MAIASSSLPASGRVQPNSARGVRVIAQDGGRYVYAAWHNVLLMSWRVAGTPADIAQFNAALEQTATAFPAGFSCVALVAGTSPIPTAEVRRELTAGFSRHSLKLACVGVVLEGDGFWASALRSVATAMHLASPRRATTRIHSDACALDAWFVEEHLRRTGVRFAGVELHAALDFVRGA